jgi:hypothetical protein
MAKDDYDKDLARIRRMKISKLASIPNRLQKTDRDHLRSLVDAMEQGGPGWSPGPEDGQWVDKIYQEQFAKPASRANCEELRERASQTRVTDNLTPTNRARIASILDTSCEKWTREQINWIQGEVIKAEMRAEDDGEE